MRNDGPPFPDHEPPPPPDPGDNVRPLRPTTLVNPEAERALLGAILLEPPRAALLRDHVDPADFDEPRNEQIWNAIYAVVDNHIDPDPITVTDRLRETGELKRIGGAYVPALLGACPSPANAEQYATQIRNAARLRHVDIIATKLKHLANTGSPDGLDTALAESLQTLDDGVARVGPRHAALIRIPNIDELLAVDDTDTYDWVIPGLIEAQERIILTAEEGAGKSTLLRQIGITGASGIHPFTGDRFDPVSVLHVDVENNARQSRRRYRPLRIQAGDNLNPNNLHIEIRVEGMDLTQPEDRDWLLKTVSAVQPDLLLIGPIYKLANGDPNEETSAKPVAMAIDEIRARTDCAVILEAHVPKATGGSRKRPMEPYGWSGWMRWPEVGIFMAKDGTLTHWRGAREERDWPAELKRGGTWPWTPTLLKPDENWVAIQKARVDAGKPISLRDLEKATGLSKSTIHRLVGAGGKYAHGWPGFNTSTLVGDKR